MSSVDTLKTSPTTADRGFEYLDHTADVQIHSWAPALTGAFEEAAIGMIGYMTDLDCIEIDEELDPFTASIEAEDLQSLLYDFMTEVLVAFQTEFVIFCEIEITSFNEVGPKCSLSFTARGERWDDTKHPQGTEVKAITYSAMKVEPPKPGRPAEIYVIVDI